MKIGFIWDENEPVTPIKIASKLIDSDISLNELQELTDHLAAYICRKRHDESEKKLSMGGELYPCQK